MESGLHDHLNVHVESFKSLHTKRFNLRLPKFSGVETGGHRGHMPPPPNFFEGPKVPFFVTKSALFVEANVAVKTTYFNTEGALFCSPYAFTYTHLHKLVTQFKYYFNHEGALFIFCTLRYALLHKPVSCIIITILISKMPLTVNTYVLL